MLFTKGKSLQAGNHKTEMRRRRRSPRYYRPEIEQLESREVPTSITWTGGFSGGNWTDPQNWGGAGIPGAGVDLIFPDNVSTANKSNTNNLTGLSVNSISFTQTGGGYTLTGNPITIAPSSSSTLTPGIINQTGDFHTISFTGTTGISLGGNVTFDGSSGQLGITSSVDLGGHNLILAGSSLTTFNKITGVLTADGNITKNSGTQWVLGAVTLTSNSIFTSNATTPGNTGDLLDVTGPLTLNSFNLSLAGTFSNNRFDGSVSANANAMISKSGASLWTFTGPVTLNGATTFVSTSGATAFDGLKFQGTINLNSFNLTLDGNATSNSSIGSAPNGTISGSGGIIKTGPGKWTVHGNNTYSGQTTINAGALAPESNTAFGTGPTLVNAGGALFVDIGSNQTASFANPLTINGAGSTTFPGAIFFSSLASNLTVTGPLTLGSTSTIFSNTSSASVITLTSPVSIGSNNLTILGQLNYITQGGITGTGTVNNQGLTLSGTGSIQGPVAIASGASLSPGVPTTTGTSPGVLNTGNLTFTAGSNFLETINGASAGSNYSQVVVTGTINLANATLNPNLLSGFTPTAGSSFVMMESTGSVTGTFNNLGDGATLMVGSVPFLIHYVNSTTAGGVGPDSFFGRVVLAATPLNTFAIVAASQNPATTQGVTLTSSVVGVINAPATAGGVGQLGGPDLPASGSVQFMDFGAPIGSSVSLDNNGFGSFFFQLGVGNHSITAVYTSNSNKFSGTTSAAYALTVNGAGWHDVLTGDFLGNGKQDIAGMTASGDWWVAVSNGTSFTNQLWDHWSTAVTWVDVQAGDFNGDGKTDIVGRVAQSGEWWVAQSNGSAFTNSSFGSWSASPGVTWADVKVGEFDGDTKSDITGRWAQAGEWYTAISNGSAFTTTLWATWAPIAWEDVKVGNFGGGAKAGITGRYGAGGQWWTGISTGTSFMTSLWATWAPDGPGVTWADVQVGDFNGDGMADITGRWAQAGQWWTGISNGTSFMTSLWSTWAANGPGVTWVDVRVGDFDKDGKADITGRWLQAGEWWTGISNGTSFTTTRWDSWSPGANWVDVAAADVNGDGYTDLVGRWGDTGQWWVALNNGSGAFTNQLWTSWAP